MRTVEQEEEEEEEKGSTFIKRSNVRRTVSSAALAVTDFTKCRVRDNAHRERLNADDIWLVHWVLSWWRAARNGGWLSIGPRCTSLER